MNEFTSILPQVLIDGLTLGFVYAIVAIGYTMVYGILEFINFAHSEIFMFGAVAGAEVLLIMGDLGLIQTTHPAVTLLLVLVVSMSLSGLLGMGIELLAYRPLRKAQKVVSLIAAIGMSLFIQDMVRLSEDIHRNAFYLSPKTLFPGGLNVGELFIPFKAMIVISVALLMMAGLTLFVNRTKLGKAMRAVAFDPQTASLMTINVNQIISLTFLIGSAMGGAAGALFAIQYSLIHPYIGFILGLKAFTAAVFGGIGNIPGAMVGGVLLGLFEAVGAAGLGFLSGGNFGSEYKDVFAFALLIIILIFKPNGLLGQVLKEKV